MIKLLEELRKDNDSKSSILKEAMKEHDSKLFNKIKEIKTPVKNDLLIILLDGEWHSETELIRTAKRQRQYAGAVLVGTMLNSINAISQEVFLKKKIINGEWHFKISDNYVGMTRAAFTRTAYRKFSSQEF